MGVDYHKIPKERSQPTSLREYFGYGKDKVANHETLKDLYQKHYFEAFYTVINCIEDQFNQEDFKMYAMLKQVLLHAAKGSMYVH